MATALPAGFDAERKLTLGGTVLFHKATEPPDFAAEAGGLVAASDAVEQPPERPPEMQQPQFNQTTPNVASMPSSSTLTSAITTAMSWSLMPVGGVLAGTLLGIGLLPGALIVGGAYLATTLMPLQPGWRDIDVRREVGVAV